MIVVISMISEEILERLSERLVNRIENLNTYFINKIGNQIKKIGTITPSQLSELMQSVQYGADLEELMNKIAEITDMNVKDIYEIFEEVAKKNQYYSKKFYDYKKIKFIPYDENKILQEQVKSVAKATANEYVNMSKTFAYMTTNNEGIKEFTSLSDIYQKITDEAILNVAQGRESYQISMQKAMKEMTSNGLKVVDYASGYSRRADSSVRMNMMDGIRRLNRENQEIFGKEFGADGVEISHHKYAAPDHIDTIDGKQFSKNGDVVIDGIKYEDYDTINNSLKRHVGELNCYHFPMEIVLGISEPLYSKEEIEKDKEENKKGFEFEGRHYTMYEGTQLQRQIETKIRQYKDRQIGAKAINDTDEVYHCQEKIRQLTDKYKELSDVSGLPTKVDRLRVDGYRSVNINKSNDITNVSNNYIDVTEKKTTSKKDKGTIKDAESITINGKTYFVNSQNKIIHKNNEEHITKLLIDTFGGTAEYLPDIGEVDNVRCGDIFYENEIWDIKELGPNATSEKRAVDNLLKESKGQSNNFILDISDSKLDRKNIISQIEKLYSTKNRDWIDKIIVFDKDKLIKVYERKNKRG